MKFFGNSKNKFLSKTMGLIMMILMVVSALPVFAADKPDLELNSIGTDSVQLGEVGAISIYIRNLRATDTGSFKVDIDVEPSSYTIINGQLSQTYDGLQGGEGLTHTVKLVFNKRGQYKIKAMLDADNDVDEVKEDNNVLYSEIIIGQSAMLDFHTGETKIVNSGGKEYEVQYVSSTNGVATFKVNGEVIKLEVGDKETLADNTPFELIGLEFEGMVASIYMPAVESARPVMPPLEIERELLEPKHRMVPPVLVPEELPEPHPEEEQYGQCISDLAKLKDDINKHYQAGEEVPEDLLAKYKDLEKHCAQMKPGIQSPVRALEAKEDCVGCLKQNGESKCIQLGTRLVENGVPAYCDFDGRFKAQKKLGENAQNNYECFSNTAADGKCVSIEERIQAVEKELKEQRNLIQKILDFFGRLFKRG